MESPDGRSLLATGQRDHLHRDADRLIQIDITQRKAERILSNAMVKNAKLSSDGKRVLLTREGERWWRKGYQGERASQVWLLDLITEQFQELLHEGVDCLWPVWMADSKGFYFTKGARHGLDLWRYRFAKDTAMPGKQKKVWGFEEDSIVMPSISRDGKTIVFRHLFDIYSYRPGKDEMPQKVPLTVSGDVDLPADELRREFSEAEHVAFVAGGDVWVMDTKLREPQRITNCSGYEKNVLFSPDGQQIWFTSVTAGKTDVWKASRHNEDKFWWQNDKFRIEQMTDDMHVESDLRFTPDGQHLVFQQGRGDLVVLDLESKQKRVLVTGFSGIDFDISSDSRWIAYSQQDEDFNSEIWIRLLSGETEPVNITRHPDNDHSPKFSPDGKLLAFTGRRENREVDIHYVYLQLEQDEETSRQRRLKEALELLSKKRKTPTADKITAKSTDLNGGESSKADTEDPTKHIQIDFDRIHERVRKLSIANSTEANLLFSPDSQKLAFSATIDGKRGWYGRQGLVIDVRDNGGGSTTDLLLTALTQPKHAITVPRGGKQGYPQDRTVYTSWSKPIIVMCNQNSYSNAGIFSHAIKSLGRGKVVGVQTAGGVVSTGVARVNDVGTIRVPFRGWFVMETGQDMELNGCVPDEILWPAPGELPQGVDRQLNRAVEMLLEEVGEGQEEKQLIYATQRQPKND